MIKNYIDITDASVVTLFYHQDINLYKEWQQNNKKYNWTTFYAMVDKIDIQSLLNVGIDFIIEVDTKLERVYYVFHGGSIKKYINISADYHFEFICKNISNKNVDVYNLMVIT